MADFVAATWNTAGGTGPDAPGPADVAPVLRQLDHHEVTLLLLQELSRHDVVEALRDAGWAVGRIAPQYAVAWRRHAWEAVTDAERVELAATHYTRVGGARAAVDAARVVLRDHEGRTLTALSYHLPAHVQVAHKPPNRIRALREAMRTLRQLGRAARTRACLFGGDDNVDERLSHGPWAFMLRKATGLRQVQAPRATHGRTRRIDDFRFRGLRAGHGLTIPGAGDHRIHVRVFHWRHL